MAAEKNESEKPAVNQMLVNLVGASLLIGGIVLAYWGIKNTLMTKG